LTLTVDSFTPQWYFCKQSSSLLYCYTGMIFAINPGEYMGKFRQNTKKSNILSFSARETLISTYSISSGLGKPISLSVLSKAASTIQNIVVLTKTITAECQTGILEVKTAASSTIKRSLFRLSVSESLLSTIWGKIGKMVLGYFILLLG